MTGHIYNPRTEPTAVEWEIAFTLGRGFSLIRSPARHRAEVLVSYREGVIELLAALQRKWLEVGELDSDFSVRPRADVYALELLEVIDVLRGNVPGRNVRPVINGEKTP